jgi:hypothetical protein
VEDARARVAALHAQIRADEDTRLAHAERICAALGDSAQGFVACADLLVAVPQAIADAQKTVDTLAVVTQTNAIVPMDIWNTENRIRGKIRSLIFDLNALVERLASQQRFRPLPAFGYRDRPDPVVVDEVSRAQIQRCADLVQGLQGDLLGAEQATAEGLQLVSEALAAIKRLPEARQESEGKQVMDSESGTFDHGQREFLELRAELAAKQQRELGMLTELIDGLPIKTREQVQDFSERKIEPTIIALPAKRKVPPLPQPAMPAPNSLGDALDAVFQKIELGDRPAQVPRPAYAVSSRADGGIARLFATWREALIAAANPGEVNALLHRKMSLEREIADVEAKGMLNRQKRASVVARKAQWAEAIAQYTAELPSIAAEIDKTKVRLKKASLVQEQLTKAIGNANERCGQLKEELEKRKAQQLIMESLQAQMQKVEEEDRELDDRIAARDGDAQG